MWTPTTREQHSRKALRYQTDLTDALIEPHLPRLMASWPMREITAFSSNAGWLPLALAAKRFATVGQSMWFAKFRDDGLVARSRAGRTRSPIIDSQSQDDRGYGPRGYDAGNGAQAPRAGRLLEAIGEFQDRDGGGPLLCASRGSFPFIEKVFADSGYAGEKVATATVIAVEIVRKSPDQVGFAVQPRRWVVERFFAWINRNRRLAKDFEATIASARPSSTPPPSCSSSADWPEPHDFRNRL